MFVLCKPDGALSMLLVDMRAEGVRVGEPDRKMGNHFQLTADVYFDDVFVPQERLVGAPGRGLRAAALTSLTLGRVGIGACGWAWRRPPSITRSCRCRSAASSAARLRRTMVAIPAKR